MTMTDTKANNDLKNILITGAAGFIGFHLSLRLLKDGYNVTGIDNLNDYYDPKLKNDRLSILKEFNNFTFKKIDLEDQGAVQDVFSNKFDVAINLAAQAGVRYSLENPNAYVDSNIVGFVNILEGCRKTKVKHFVFASSSSVYGGNTKLPLSVHDNVDHPVSLYAASKKANELMAHSYSHLFNLPCTGLRFFTVYGPWGRPDMALCKFTKAIMEDKPIDVYNHGKMKRDFTYIDDIVEGVVRVMHRIPSPSKDWDKDNPDPSSSWAPYKIYNIGNNQPVDLMTFVKIIEQTIGKEAKKNFLPLQAGDVVATYADISDLAKDVGFTPATTLEEGIPKFIDWYKTYYNK